MVQIVEQPVVQPEVILEEVKTDTPVVKEDTTKEEVHPAAEESNLDSTMGSIEESKEVPPRSGKLTFTIESAKILDISKTTRVSAEFEWSGEIMKTS